MTTWTMNGPGVDRGPPKNRIAAVAVEEKMIEHIDTETDTIETVAANSCIGH